ncbi:MAG: hypothetical protein HFE90_03190 [Firmicutes bacterium]|nr:hypothetical protein [Bacillota bacterium]
MKDSRIDLDNAEEINDHGILFKEARILKERSINIEYLKDCGDYIAFKGDELIDSCKTEYLDRMIERLIK